LPIEVGIETDDQGAPHFQGWRPQVTTRPHDPGQTFLTAVLPRGQLGDLLAFGDIDPGGLFR
jgi:hypothetical protein